MRWLAILLVLLSVSCGGRSTPAPPVDPPIDPPVDPPAKLPPHIVSLSPSTLPDGILGLVGSEIPLSAEVTGDGPFEWEWVFADGLVLDDPASPTPLATLDKPGPLTGRVTVSGPGGSDTEEFAPSIDTVAPFVGSVTQGEGRPTFRHAATLDASLFGERPIALTWHFDERIRIVDEAETAISVMADVPGTYGGFVIASNAHGQSAAHDFTVEIFDAAPVAWTNMSVAAVEMPTFYPIPELVLHGDSLVLMIQSQQEGLRSLSTPLASLDANPVWTTYTVVPDIARNGTERWLVSWQGRLGIIVIPPGTDAVPQLWLSDVGLPADINDWRVQDVPGINPALATSVALTAREESLLLLYGQELPTGWLEVRCLESTINPPVDAADWNSHVVWEVPENRFAYGIDALAIADEIWVSFIRTIDWGSGGSFQIREWRYANGAIPTDPDGWEYAASPPHSGAGESGHPATIESFALAGQRAMAYQYHVYQGSPNIQCSLPLPGARSLASALGTAPTGAFAAAVADDRAAIAYVAGSDDSLWIARERSGESTSASWTYSTVTSPGHTDGLLSMVAHDDRLVVAWFDPTDDHIWVGLANSVF